VVRNESGAQGELVSNVADAMLPVAEESDDPNTRWLGYRLQAGHDIGGKR
jgi:hypothetical protein